MTRQPAFKTLDVIVPLAREQNRKRLEDSFYDTTNHLFDEENEDMPVGLWLVVDGGPPENGLTHMLGNGDITTEREHTTDAEKVALAISCIKYWTETNPRQHHVPDAYLIVGDDTVFTEGWCDSLLGGGLA
jgi:hypothetical protein